MNTKIIQTKTRLIRKFLKNRSQKKKKKTRHKEYKNLFETKCKPKKMVPLKINHQL